MTQADLGSIPVANIPAIHGNVIAGIPEMQVTVSMTSIYLYTSLRKSLITISTDCFRIYKHILVLQ